MQKFDAYRLSVEDKKQILGGFTRTICSDGSVPIPICCDNMLAGWRCEEWEDFELIDCPSGEDDVCVF